MLEVTGIVYADRGSIPFATGYPCGKGVVLNAGERVDPLHVALAPIEYCFSGPVMEIIESQFLQDGVDGLHLLLLSFHSGWPVCHHVARPILHSHSTLPTPILALLFSPFVLLRQQRSGQWART